MSRQTPRSQHPMEKFSAKVTKWTGSAWAFVIALSVIVIWAVTGPIFGFSDTWQLVINTGTTVVTFLMVFLIQRGQNKESLALQLKVNELIAAVKQANNRLIDAEDFCEDDLRTLQEHYRRLSRMAHSEAHLSETHSVQAAEHRHRDKKASDDANSAGRTRGSK